MTGSFPRAEEFGLSAQMRRASTSIGANLAEGLGRGSDRDTARFIAVAIGSTNELEQHLTTASDVGFLPPASARELLNSAADVRRMLTGLHKTVRQRAK